MQDFRKFIISFIFADLGILILVLDQLIIREGDLTETILIVVIAFCNAIT